MSILVTKALSYISQANHAILSEVKGQETSAGDSSQLNGDRSIPKNIDGGYVSGYIYRDERSAVGNITNFLETSAGPLSKIFSNISSAFAKSPENPSTKSFLIFDGEKTQSLTVQLPENTLYEERLDAGRTLMTRYDDLMLDLQDLEMRLNASDSEVTQDSVRVELEMLAGEYLELADLDYGDVDLNQEIQFKAKSLAQKACKIISAFQAEKLQQVQLALPGSQEELEAMNQTLLAQAYYLWALGDSESAYQNFVLLRDDVPEAADFFDQLDEIASKLKLQEEAVSKKNRNLAGLKIWEQQIETSAKMLDEDWISSYITEPISDTLFFWKESAQEERDKRKHQALSLIKLAEIEMEWKGANTIQEALENIIANDGDLYQSFHHLAGYYLDSYCIENVDSIPSAMIHLLGSDDLESEESTYWGEKLLHNSYMYSEFQVEMPEVALGYYHMIAGLFSENPHTSHLVDQATEKIRGIALDGGNAPWLAQAIASFKPELLPAEFLLGSSTKLLRGASSVWIWNSAKNPGLVRRALAGAGNFLTYLSVRNLLTKTQNGKGLAQDTASTGGTIAFAGLLCYLVPQLRPFSQGLTNFLFRAPVRYSSLVAGSYLAFNSEQLEHDSEQMGRFFSWDAYEGDNNRNSRTQDAFGLLASGVGKLGVVANVSIVAGSLMKGLSTFFKNLKAGESKLQSLNQSWYALDGFHRSWIDPSSWAQNARGDNHLPQWLRFVLIHLGEKTQSALVWGGAAGATGNLAVNSWDLGGKLYKGEEVGLSQGFGLISQLAMDVFPSAMTVLAGAARGSSKMDMEPSRNQEMTEEVIMNKKRWPSTIRLAIRSGFQLAKNALKKYVQNTQTQLQKIYQEQSEELPPKIERDSHVLIESVGDFDFPYYGDGNKVRTALNQGDWSQVLQADIRAALKDGTVTVRELRDAINHDPYKNEGSYFPRPVDRGPLGKALDRRAEAIQEQIDYAVVQGEDIPLLAGANLSFKDLGIIPSGDGEMNMGSRNARIDADFGVSELGLRYEDAGAILVPTAMVAAAHGGNGDHVMGGSVTNPTHPQYQQGGSSASQAALVGDPQSSSNNGSGTDTYGSTTNPASMTNLYGLALPVAMTPRKNLGVSDPRTDRPGPISKHPQDLIEMAKVIVGPEHAQQLKPSDKKPVLAVPLSIYHESDPRVQKSFDKNVEKLRRKGYKVVYLDERYNRFFNHPVDLYSDARTTALMARINPLKPHNTLPKPTVDHNVQERFSKGLANLTEKIEVGGQEKRIFEHIVDLDRVHKEQFRQTFGKGVAIIMPGSDPVPHGISKGEASDIFDKHDRKNPKNRVPETAQLTIPDFSEQQMGGVHVAGDLPDLMRVLVDVADLPTKTNAASEAVPLFPQQQKYKAAG